MIKSIKLKNFKCFRAETRFPLGNMTLLTSINGRGKSTLLQSLLLIKQSIDIDEDTTQLFLNGDLVHLGSWDDVKSSGVSEEENILFEFEILGRIPIGEKPYIPTAISYEFNPNSEDKVILNLNSCKLNNELNIKFKNGKCQIIADEEFKKSLIKKYAIHDDFSEENSVFFEYLLPRVNRFYYDNWGDPCPTLVQFKTNLSKIHYISAHRLGPQEFYYKRPITKYPSVGAKGEYTTNVLDKRKDSLVQEDLCLGDDAHTLITQTEEWMAKIFGGAKIEIPNSNTNILQLFFNTSASKDRFTPENESSI